MTTIYSSSKTRQAGLQSVRNLGREQIFIALIAVTALAVRLWDLGARSLWFDEGIEYWSAKADVSQIAAAVRASMQPPLYSLTLHFWQFLSTGDIWMRLLSVIASLTTLALAMVWSYRLRGWGGALVSGAVLMLMPSEIRYAQEIAEYALLECLLSAALLALFLTFTTMDRRIWALWGICSVLAIYAHYGASFVIAAASLTALVENILRRDRARVIRMSVVGALSAGFLLPLLLFLPGQASKPQASTAPIAFTFKELRAAVMAPSKTFLFHFSGWPFTKISVLPLQLLIIALLLLTIYLWFRTREIAWRRVIAWFWISFLVYYIPVRLGFYGYGNVGFRYAIILTPLFVQAVMLGLLQFSGYRAGKVMVAFVITAMLVVSAYSLPNHSLSKLTRGTMGWPETQNILKAAEFWMLNRDPADPTYVSYSASASFRAYLRRLGWEAEQDLPADWFSQCFRKTYEFCRQGSVYYGTWTRRQNLEGKTAKLAETLGKKPDRFWYIKAYNGGYNEDTEWMRFLKEEYDIQIKQDFHNVTIYYLVARN